MIYWSYWRSGGKDTDIKRLNEEHSIYPNNRVVDKYCFWSTNTQAGVSLFI